MLSKKRCATTSVNANKFYLPLAAGGLKEVADWRDLDWTMAADDAEAYQPYDHLHDLILSEMRVMEELGNGAWGKVFPDPAMTLAAVDRLVHHATIFEINVDSYRRRAALERKHKGAGRPQNYATTKDLGPVSLRDNQPQT